MRIFEFAINQLKHFPHMGPVRSAGKTRDGRAIYTTCGKWKGGQLIWEHPNALRFVIKED